MHEQIAGVSAPARLLAEVEALPQEEQGPFLLDHAVSLAHDLLALPWVSGLHLIPLGGAELVIDLLDRLGPVTHRPEDPHGNSAHVPH
jgi:hypothetical protein